MCAYKCDHCSYHTIYTLLWIYSICSHGLRETLLLCITYMTVTPLFILTCPMSHQYVGGCDMWQSWSGGSLFLCTTYVTVAMTPLLILACPMSHQVVGGCDMWQSWSEGDSISMYYIYDGSYDTSVYLGMSCVSSVCRWM